jgi:ABC-type Zn uptake system ZnuABC Zn-binding protein ZnuA
LTLGKFRTFPTLKLDDLFKKNNVKYTKIISPHDKEIAKSIEKNLKPISSSWNVDEVEDNKLRKEPFDEVYKSYYNDMKSLSLYRYRWNLIYF